MTSEPHADDNASPIVDSELSVQEEVQMETSVESSDAEEKVVYEKEDDNPDVSVSEDTVEEPIEQTQEERSDHEPEDVDAADTPQESENGLESTRTDPNRSSDTFVATTVEEDANGNEKKDGAELQEIKDYEPGNQECTTDGFNGDSGMEHIEMDAPPTTPGQLSTNVEGSLPTAATEMDSSALMFRLEECLYGTSTTVDRTTQSQDTDEHSMDFLVDDDWVHIREQRLWKTAPHSVDLSLLRRIASQAGIQEEGSHRAVAWRVMLGYLPPDNREWERTLTERRNEYKTFVKEWFTNSHDCFHGDELRWKHRMPPNCCSSNAEDGEEDTKRMENKQSEQETAPVEEENKLQSPIRERLKKAGLDAGVLDSIMKNFNSLQITKVDGTTSLEDGAVLSETDSTVDFVDSVKLLDQIRKDVDRTFPDLKFFLDPERNLGKRRYAALERILFTWSKFNKGVNYVQGMNEIVGTIYYVLANDWNEEWAQEAEADTFWLFGILLGDMRDVFISHMDDSETGIYSRIKMMQTLLCRHDAEIIEHFDDIGIESSFFAIRWWTTLLSREFLLPDTIRLWDSMFASTHKDNFLCYVCVTMVIMIREQLLKGDFSACLRTLQSYPSIRMDELLTASRTLWLYERQITVACHKGGIGLQQALEAVRPPEAIIMAFGFRGGIIPGSQWDTKSPSRAEAIQKAREVAAASVRGAGTAVKGWLGRATKLASNLGEQVKLTRTVSSESAQSSDMVLASYSADEDDDVYMQAIQSAESGKYSYTK